MKNTKEKEAIEKIVSDLRKDEVFYLPKRSYGRNTEAMLKNNKDGKLLAFGMNSVDLLEELQSLNRNEKATTVMFCEDGTYTGK